MQPFGLFSLLQTLASSATAPQTPPADDTNAPSAEPCEQPVVDEPRDTANESNRQAVLQFLQAHEQRAKQIKKR